MNDLYLYSNGPRGDVMFCRAVYRLVASAARGFDVVLGACRDDAELLADLRGPRCRIVASDFANTPHGAVVDLDYLCPAGHVPLAVWLGGGERLPSYQWADVVESLQQDLRDRGVDIDVDFAAAAEHVPMLDFGDDVPPPALPQMRRPSIWIDNDRTAQQSCWFVLDFERLVDVLPGLDLLCTAPTGWRHEQIVDVSALGPIARQKLSERCVALVGLTMDPFNVTLTEANRFKPKALCGYDARVTGVAWDYPGNPLELLGSMDELVDHLLATVAVGARA